MHFLLKNSFFREVYFSRKPHVSFAQYFFVVIENDLLLLIIPVLAVLVLSSYYFTLLAFLLLLMPIIREALVLLAVSLCLLARTHFCVHIFYNLTFALEWSWLHRLRMPPTQFR